MFRHCKTFRLNSLIAVLAAVVLTGVASTSLAQNAPPSGGNQGGGGGNQGGPGGGNRRDPAQMRQMNDRMKVLLGATDDEWKLLQPQIEKVQTLQRTAAPRNGRSLLFSDGNGDNGGRGGRGGRGAQQPDNTPPSAVEERSKELTAAIQNKDTKPEEYKAKLAAFREARNQAKADLTKAQESLREVVTVRQEAVLVELGLLD